MPADSSLILSTAAIAGTAVVARVAMPDAAPKAKLRIAGAILAVDLLAHAAWAYGPTFPMKYWGATFASILVCFAVALVPATALAGVLRAAAKRVVRWPETPTAPAPTVTRRAFVGGVTATAPAVAVGLGATGFASANAPASVKTVRMEIEALPDELAGLRILQLSDLHLGVERRARDVEALVERIGAGGRVPDLVVLTGDVAEDPNELVPALAALRRLRTRLGVVATLGNHEYFGDVRRTRRDYERAGVPLLVSAGMTLRLGKARLHVAGLDDPRVMHGEIEPFLEESLARALDGSPSDATRLVLSHRPEGLVPAARAGAHVVLSGHTHGGQVGFANKSAFEPIWPERYLWGRYRRDRTQLYTTSGFGHWFPFRVLCPTEAPVVELVRA